MKSLFLDALVGKNHEGRAPIWLLRQAGRYMSSYQALRRRHSLLELFASPEAIAEVTMLPINELDVDAAIIFSDILLILDALKCGLSFQEGVGPVIASPVRSSSDVDALPDIDVEESFTFLSEAIKLLLPQLQVPLIGFAGGPLTVASYLVEGGSSKQLKRTCQWIYRDPESFCRLMQKITSLTIELLTLQIKSGVKAVMLFETWAIHLSSHTFHHLLLPFLQQIRDAVKAMGVPFIFFCRGTASYLPSIAELKPDVLHVDWSANLADIRRQLDPSIALQGNFDPCALYASKEEITRQAQAMMQMMEGDPGYIFNLGHGVLPDVPYDNVCHLVETVKEGMLLCR